MPLGGSRQKGRLRGTNDRDIDKFAGRFDTRVAEAIGNDRIATIPLRLLRTRQDTRNGRRFLVLNLYRLRSIIQAGNGNLCSGRGVRGCFLE